MRARKRAEAKVSFYWNLAAYAAVNPFLILIWWITSGPGSYPWFIWPLAGWALGVVFHGVSVFRAGEG